MAPKRITFPTNSPPADSYVKLQNFGNKMFDVLYIFLPPFIFPQGGKVLTPSPVGEGREGGLKDTITRKFI
jgi:hypothetical protein